MIQLKQHIGPEQLKYHCYLATFDLKRIGRCGTFGIGILCNFPILKKKTFYYKQMGTRQTRGAIAIKIDPNYDKKNYIWIVCTHLHNDVTGYEQELQSIQLLNFIKTELGENIVVGGDLNSTPYFNSIKILENHFGNRNCSKKLTFPLLYIPIINYQLGFKLDYLYVSGKNIKKTCNNRVIDTDRSSDHYPVVCDISLKI